MYTSTLFVGVHTSHTHTSNSECVGSAYRQGRTPINESPPIIHTCVIHICPVNNHSLVSTTRVCQRSSRYGRHNVSTDGLWLISSRVLCYFFGVGDGQDRWRHIQCDVTPVCMGTVYSKYPTQFDCVYTLCLYGRICAVFFYGSKKTFFNIFFKKKCSETNQPMRCLRRASNVLNKSSDKIDFYR